MKKRGKTNSIIFIVASVFLVCLIIAGVFSISGNVFLGSKLLKKTQNPLFKLFNNLFFYNEQNTAITIITTPITSPWQFPVDGGTIRCGFRTKERPTHNGIDILKSGKDIGIKSAAKGKIISVLSSSTYGNWIIIEHDINEKKYQTVYAHLQTWSITVKKGDLVQKGQKIGIMGTTGRSTGVHLHFEIHQPAWNAKKSNAKPPCDYVVCPVSTTITPCPEVCTASSCSSCVNLCLEDEEDTTTFTSSKYITTLLET